MWLLVRGYDMDSFIWKSKDKKLNIYVYIFVQNTLNPLKMPVKIVPFSIMLGKLAIILTLKVKNLSTLLTR